MKLRNQSCQLILGHYNQAPSAGFTLVSVNLYPHERKVFLSR